MRPSFLVEPAAAVITGSAQGLGRRAAEEMLRWGCTVFGLDIAEQKPLAGDFHPLDCDVTDERALASALALVEGQGAPLRFVLANAGRYPNRPLAEWTSAEFDELWRLNVGGTFNVVKAFVPLLSRADWSRFVVVSSNAALLGVPGFVPYATTKAALLGMVRALAAETARDGVTVNAIAPGLTKTETALSSDVAPFFEPIRDAQLVPRSLEPDDILSTLRYLCDPASSMVTGQTLLVDGGVVLH